MAELRQDPTCGRWVIMATERAARPGDFKVGRGAPKGGFCPFCEGNEDRTPPEIAAIRPGGGPKDSRGWRVRVVPNKFPALSMDGVAVEQGTPLRPRVPGVGVHEVIIESPCHAVSPTQMPPSDFECVIQVYCERAEKLNAEQRLAYVLIFKNVGVEAGASIEHAHSQIVGVPVMPRRVVEELARSDSYHRRHGRCLFCDILAEDLAAGERLVAQSESFAVLSPFAAAFPFTLWLLPKFHAGHLWEMGPHRIRVNAIAPGVILTAIHEEFSSKESLESLKDMTAMGRLGLPADVAGAVLFLASDAASYITGESIAVNGGLRMDSPGGNRAGRGEHFFG